MMTRQQRQWVQLAQVGDRQALERLLESVQGPLYRYLKRLVGEPRDAEDLLQDVFVLIYRKLFWLRSPEHFQAWSFRIASRAALRFLQKQRRWPESIPESELDGLPAPALAEVVRDLGHDLESHLQAVSPRSRMVIILHYFQELTLPEVSAVLGIKLGTVKSRLAYGLKILRQQMTGEA